MSDPVEVELPGQLLEGPDGKPQRVPRDGRKGLSRRDGGRRIDFVLIYETEEGRERRQFFMSSMTNAGLLLETEECWEERGGSRQLIGFVKIHAPWRVLCREAERLRLKMPLVMVEEGREDRSEQWWQRLWNLRFLRVHQDDRTQRAEVTRPFSLNRIDRFDLASRGPDNFFSQCQRTEIVWHVLEHCRNDPGNEKRRGAEALLEHGVFSQAFPLHDGPHNQDTTQSTPRRLLYQQWAHWKCLFRPQPLNRIRNYFGEKVGFYFAFMDFYTKMLLFPSVMGLCAFVYGIIFTGTSMKPLTDQLCNEEHEPGGWVICPICAPPLCAPFVYAHEGCSQTKWEFRLDHPGAVVLSCLNLLWCAVFLKLWKRREAELACDWDTLEVEQSDEVIRPAYEEHSPQQRPNPVTGVLEPHMPAGHRLLRVSASVAATLVMLLLAGVCLMGLVVSRIQMYGAIRALGGSFAERSVELARFGVHGLQFVMVMLFESAYHHLAHKLTELECPRTPSQFLSSLLWKVFIFALLVDFLPIGYAAWVKGHAAGAPVRMNLMSELCEPSGCMSEVAELVAVLLLCRLVLGNMGEIGVPFLASLVTRLRAGADADHTEWPQYVTDSHLNQLQLDGVAEEYMEMMIQLSFVVFFVPALPLAPLLCLLNNIAEIRVDAMNILVQHRRPVPVRVPGVQIWNRFMEIILKVGVLCNAALISFTSDVVPRTYYRFGSGLWNGSYANYAHFSLSYVHATDWPALRTYMQEHGEHQKHQGHHEEHGSVPNVSRCYYLDMRKGEPPYEHTQDWWTIMCFRLITFATFLLTFYTLIFLLNIMISDRPRTVDQRAKRHRCVVEKANIGG